MTVKELFELSEIQNNPNFKTMDYAVPFDRKTGRYSFDGREISVCWKGSFEIIPYATLKIMAIENVSNKIDLLKKELAKNEETLKELENI